MRSSTPALMTDMYELTMLDAMLADGTAGSHAVFEAFTRRLPEGRRFGLFAGLGRLLPLIEDFRFADEQIEYLRQTGVGSQHLLDYLSDFRFTGDVRSIAEGEAFWPGTPVLQVEGALGEAVLLETLALSVLNHDSAVASAAARMTIAAGGRRLIEMGSRRVHEESAIAAARAAHIAGFASTSNLEAGYRYRIPVGGTSAHAAVLARRTEAEAFAAQVDALGPGTTILVDTYDIAQGIRTAVEVAGTGLGAVRIDSGDLLDEARRARALLDELGATDTSIVVTSDLDEYLIAHLADAPIDAYGVGTRVSTGSGHPTVGMVYKLVEIDGRPVAKASASKASVGGKKHLRRLADGREGWSKDPAAPGQDLLVPQIAAGRLLATDDAAELTRQARLRAAATLDALPAEARKISAGTAYRTTEELA